MNKIAILMSKENIEIIECEIISLEIDYVRVENLYCGICGGDYSNFIGNRNKYNISLGHEFVSKVIEVGKNVNNFKVGDLVISDINFRCGSCYYCKNNQSHLCDNIEAAYFTNRSFSKISDYHKSYLIKVNNIENNIISGVNIEPLSCVIHAFKYFDISNENKILIVGLGNIGYLASFYLKKCLDLENIFVFDINKNKENFVIDNFKCKNHSKNIQYDLVFEATDDLDGLLYALETSKKGSKVCSMSHLYGIDTSKAYEKILKKEIIINFPLRNGDKNNLYTAYFYIDNFWLEEYNKSFEIFELNQINEAFYSKKRSIKNKQVISMI